jgi:hypothetical protein
MCDYSLMSIPNRLAEEGEELVTHRFGTGCMGLASPSDLRPDPNSPASESQTFWSMLTEFLNPPETEPVPAVCIPPGASLLLMDIPEKLQREFGIGPAEEVRFTQLTAAANAYRDAVRFSSGREVLLQGLHGGQRVRVLTLGPQDTSDFTVHEELVLRTGG